MEPDAIKKVLDDFLLRFERMLEKHVADIQDALEPKPQDDANKAMMLTVMNDIADDVGSILTTLEDRNGL